MGYSQGGGGHSYRGSFLLLPRGSQACPAPLLASGRVTLAYESHVPGGGGHNQERSCRVKGILDGIVPQGSGFCHDHRTPPPKKKNGAVCSSGQMAFKSVSCWAFAQAVPPAWTLFPLFCCANPHNLPLPSTHPTVQARRLGLQLQQSSAYQQGTVQIHLYPHQCCQIKGRMPSKCEFQMNNECFF